MKQHIHIFTVKFKLYVVYILISQKSLIQKRKREFFEWHKEGHKLEVMGLYTEMRSFHLIIQTE